MTDTPDPNRKAIRKGHPPMVHPQDPLKLAGGITRNPSGVYVPPAPGLAKQYAIDNLLEAHAALESMGIDFVVVNAARQKILRALDWLRGADPATGGT